MSAIDGNIVQRFTDMSCDGPWQVDSNAAVVGQVSSVAVVPSSKGANTYDIQMPDWFWYYYNDARTNAIQVGNLVSMEQGYIAGGINLNGNNVRPRLTGI